MMSSIYGKAAGVVVWLGKESEASDVGISYAKELARDAERDEVGPEHVREEITDPIRADHDKMRAFLSLLARRWFQRVWIVQEIGMSSHPAVMHCGSSTVRSEEHTSELQSLTN